MADMTAGDVMVAAPRMDLLRHRRRLRRGAACGHRHRPLALPGLRGPRENVIGILMAKDLLKLQRSPDLNLRTLLRPAVFVPEIQGPERTAARLPLQPQPPGDRDRRVRQHRRAHHHRGRARRDRRRDRGRVRRQGRRVRHLHAGRRQPARGRRRRHRGGQRRLRRAAAGRAIRHHRRPGRARAGPRAAARRVRRRSARWCSR